MMSLPATVDEMISASREFVQHSMLAFPELVTLRRLSQILFLLNFPTRRHAFLLRLTIFRHCFFFLFHRLRKFNNREDYKDKYLLLFITTTILSLYRKHSCLSEWHIILPLLPRRTFRMRDQWWIRDRRYWFSPRRSEMA